MCTRANWRPESATVSRWRRITLVIRVIKIVYFTFIWFRGHHLTLVGLAWEDDAVSFVFTWCCIGKVDHAVEWIDRNTRFFIRCGCAVVDKYVTKCSDLLNAWTCIPNAGRLVLFLLSPLGLVARCSNSGRNKHSSKCILLHLVELKMTRTWINNHSYSIDDVNYVVVDQSYAFYVANTLVEYLLSLFWSIRHLQMLNVLDTTLYIEKLDPRARTFRNCVSWASEIVNEQVFEKNTWLGFSANALVGLL